MLKYTENLILIVMDSAVVLEHFQIPNTPNNYILPGTTIHLDILFWLGKRGEFSINSLFNNWTKIPLVTQLYMGLIQK